MLAFRALRCSIAQSWYLPRSTSILSPVAYRSFVTRATSKKQISNQPGSSTRFRRNENLKVAMESNTTKSLYYETFLKPELEKIKKRKEKPQIPEEEPSNSVILNPPETPPSPKLKKSPPRVVQKRIRTPQYTEDEVRTMKREANALRLKSGYSTSDFSAHTVVLSRRRLAKVRTKEVVPKIHIDLEMIMPTAELVGLNRGLLDDPIMKEVGIRPSDATIEDQVQRAQMIAMQLNIAFAPTVARAMDMKLNYVFVVDSYKISLSNLSDPQGAIIYSDFAEGSTEYRKRTGGASLQTPLMKSIHIPDKLPAETRVLDATGGMGIDAFMMACAGFTVTIVEKSPLFFVIIYDAMTRASQLPELAPFISRMTLIHADSLSYMDQLFDAPDVVYLDPMFPDPKKDMKAPKKAMALAREVTKRVDLLPLLRKARAISKHHVSLKRPYYVADTVGATQTYKSRNMKFEVFPARSNQIGENEPEISAWDEEE